MFSFVFHSYVVSVDNMQKGRVCVSVISFFLCWNSSTC